MVQSFHKHYTNATVTPTPFYCLSTELADPSASAGLAAGKRDHKHCSTSSMKPRPWPLFIHFSFNFSFPKGRRADHPADATELESPDASALIFRILKEYEMTSRASGPMSEFTGAAQHCRVASGGMMGPSPKRELRNDCRPTCQQSLKMTLRPHFDSESAVRVILPFDHCDSIRREASRGCNYMDIDPRRFPEPHLLAKHCDL